MGTSEERYKPKPEFQEDSKEPLLDISLTDSTELWLIQWPINQDPDFDGQEVTLKLKENGLLGSFESSSGKSYDVVSFASQEPDATVFLSSGSDTKIVGKISRRVCLVHYPEPGELEKQSYTNASCIRPTGASSGNSSHLYQYTTPTQGSRRRSRHSMSLMSHSTVTPTNSIKQSSSLFERGEFSKHSKKIKSGQSTRSTNQSTQGSAGQGQSDVTFGSARSSFQGKLKRKIEDEKH